VESARSRWIVAFEAASLAAFAALWIRTAATHGSLALSAPLACASGLLVGALLADLASGAVHWACDRFGSASTPLLGPLLIAAFREHHRDPDSIGRHPLLERSGTNAFAAAAALAALHTALPALGPGAGAFALGALLASTALTASTNEIHLQAHRSERPRWVSALQRAGLVLRPAEHARHHSGSHDRAYCIATGWSNPLLERLGVFARLERRLGRGE
jgi:ubiquitin-conjugating enzyme E2 variant